MLPERSFSRDDELASAWRALVMPSTLSCRKQRSMALRRSPARSIGSSCGRPVSNSAMVLSMLSRRVARLS